MSSQVSVQSNGNGASPPSSSGQGGAAMLGAFVSERPEIAVGVAFIGGLIVARIIRRLGR